MCRFIAPAVSKLLPGRGSGIHWSVHALILSLPPGSRISSGPGRSQNSGSTQNSLDFFLSLPQQTSVVAGSPTTHGRTRIAPMFLVPSREFSVSPPILNIPSSCWLPKQAELGVSMICLSSVSLLPTLTWGCSRQESWGLGRLLLLLLLPQW